MQGFNSRVVTYITTRDCRQIAYDMAKINNVQIPKSWEENKMAGTDWLRGFRERFPEMTLRKPENCSTARATSFNRETIKIFFDNLQNVLSRSRCLCRWYAHLKFRLNGYKYCAEKSTSFSSEGKKEYLQSVYW